MGARWFSSWVLCGLALNSWGQDLRVAGPITGIVFDQPSRSLRHVLGVPGAARLGPPILTDLDWASVSPDSRTALVSLQGEVHWFSSTSDPSSDAGGVPLTGIVDSPICFTWAADSRAVVLYSATSRSVQWVRATDQGPVADVPLPLTGVDGEVTALAAESPSGPVVLVSSAGVYQLSASTGTRLILPVSDGSVVALEPGGSTLWVSDRSTGQLLRTSTGSEQSPQIVLSDPENLADITAMTLSADRTRLYLANRTKLRLFVFDTGNGILSDGGELDAPVTQFLPLGRPSLLLLQGLRDQPEQPLYVLDETSGPGVFFIPAGGGQ